MEAKDYFLAEQPIISHNVIMSTFTAANSSTKARQRHGTVLVHPTPKLKQELTHALTVMTETWRYHIMHPSHHAPPATANDLATHPPAC